MLQEGFHLPKGDDVTFHPSVSAHRLQRVFSAAAGGRVGFKILRRDGAELAYSLRKQGCPGEHQGPLEAAGVHRRQASPPQLETRKQVPEICVSTVTLLPEELECLFFFFFIFLIGGTLLYSVVLASAVQQPEAALSAHKSPPSRPPLHQP